MDNVNMYQLGRPIEAITAPYSGKDLTFAAERLGNQTIESAKYAHCTFVNISFKEAKLVDGSFVNCVFVGCYFRRAELRNCNFVGCRFIDCNFNHIAIMSCDFRYSLFRGCQVAYSELVHSLPSEPNLCEELARNLSIESESLGLSRESRSFRMAGIKAHEKHLKAAFQGSSQWYREHYKAFRRAGAFLQWVLSLLNGWFWGYGERATVLIRNLIILSFGLFPILFFLFQEQLCRVSGKPISFLDPFIFSLENIVPAGIDSDIIAIGSITRFLAGLESLFGVVALALFAAYIFRWSLHR